MAASGDDVTVKAELQYLRLDVQNLQLQLQCVHQGMLLPSSPNEFLTYDFALQSLLLHHLLALCWQH